MADILTLSSNLKLRMSTRVVVFRVLDTVGVPGGSMLTSSVGVAGFTEMVICECDKKKTTLFILLLSVIKILLQSWYWNSFGRSFQNVNIAQFNTSRWCQNRCVEIYGESLTLEVKDIRSIKAKMLPCHIQTINTYNNVIMWEAQVFYSWPWRLPSVKQSA